MPRTISWIICIAVITIVAQAGPAASTPQAGSAKWDWLANTYWHVPQKNLAAIQYNTVTGQMTPVLDQTVFQIQGAQGGYFWGKTVVQLRNLSSGTQSSALCLFMVGSVTPEGSLLISFNLAGTGSGLANTTSGSGRMRRKGGKWTMEMQMASPGVKQVSHWAYMKQCVPTDPCWQKLPGQPLSLPAFLSQCP